MDNKLFKYNDKREMYLLTFGTGSYFINCILPGKSNKYYAI